ncbi:MAG: exo-alpha-sialidase [candidate division Zixibacteria bacterium]|nr:exo-alpha-sialidase [candidate division Zixibacteria bacterium]
MMINICGCDHTIINYKNPVNPVKLDDIERYCLKNTSVYILFSEENINPTPFSFKVIDYPHHGSVHIIDTAFIYSPDTNFVGLDTLSFVAITSQGQVISNEATISIMIKPEPLISVERIWENSFHNAFTDLIRFEDKWFCLFREGETHLSLDGSIRLISSEDGKNWSSVKLFSSDEGDLRDPKLNLTPDGKLMISSAITTRQPWLKTSLIWFSVDGDNWNLPVNIGEENIWLWRIIWHNQIAYSFGYLYAYERFNRLYQSSDGINYTSIVDSLDIKGNPSEGTILFIQNDTMLCLMRRDNADSTALLGRSSSPYTNWYWTELNFRIGGQDMIIVPDGRIIVGARLYNPERTAICILNPVLNTLDEIITLPSGGDNSYPGLYYYKGLLWVSYYSSHEGSTDIYLAKIVL